MMSFFFVFIGERFGEIFVWGGTREGRLHVIIAW